MIAGGGTAGHAFPALAVARALTARGLDPAGVHLVSSRRGPGSSLLAGEGFPIVEIPGRGVVRSWSLKHLAGNLAAVGGLLRATLSTMTSFVIDRPRVVVAVGGYASLPAGLAAALLRIPLVVVNVDVVPGLVNRLLARRARACAVAYADTLLPRAEVTGVPVREEVLGVRRSSSEGRAMARKALGLPLDRWTIGVVGGSLGARRVNQAAASLAERWAGRGDLAIYHASGWRDYEELARRRGLTGAPDAAVREPQAGELYYRCVPFCERIDLLYMAVDVMVSRAGAMTVAELAVAGVPAVFVPLPDAPGDHQTKNAQALVAEGGGVLVPDSECVAERLEAVVDELLGDAERLALMSDAATRAAHRDAAERIAALVEEVAGRAAGPEPGSGPGGEAPGRLVDARG